MDTSIPEAVNLCRKRSMPCPNKEDNKRMKTTDETEETPPECQSVTKVTSVGVQVSNDRAVSYGKVARHITFTKLLSICFIKESTLEFCFNHNLLPRNKNCPVCGKAMSLISAASVSDGKKWYCRKKSKSGKNHEKRLSIRSGTFFEKSHMTLEEILKFVYLWIHGCPLKTIHHELGLGSNTDVDWASFCREVTEMAVTSASTKIGGPGIVVEIHITKFCKRKHHQSHPVKDGWVLAGRERDDKSKVFMECVEDRNAALDLIHKWIELNSVIWTDCCKRNDNNNPELPRGYIYRPVNYNESFVDPQTGVCANHLHSEWGQTKSFGVKEAHLPGYLATFLWKRMHSGKDLFLQLISDISFCYPGFQR